MLHRSISIGLITVFVQNNHSSRFGIKFAAAKNRHQQQREYENNGYKRQQKQQRQQQNQYGNGFGGGFGEGGGGDPFAGSGQVASEELYNYLNVTPDATEKEIKSSYRKLALEFHPDKFKADPNKSESTNNRNRSLREERFVKISQAYDVLSDEKKRRIYDRFGDKGLEMLEKGQDPEGGFGFGGFGGGFPNFNQADATKMFEEMFGSSFGSQFGGFGGGMPNMGGFGGYGGGMPDMGDFNKIFEEAMGSNPFGGYGGFGGGYPGGGGRQQGRQQQGRQQQGRQQQGRQQQGRRQQQKQQQQKPKPKPIPPPFTKGEESGVAVLSIDEKFPNSSAKHGWLIYFYDKNALANGDETTKEYIKTTKELSTAILEKAHGKKNGMLFKVGAIDCAGNEMKLCKWKLKDAELPTFATVFNGDLQVIPETDYLTDGKKLYEAAIQHLSSVEGLVVKVDTLEHIQTRLLNSSPSPDQKIVAVLLLNNKDSTPSMYKSLAYRHRRESNVVFGELGGANLAEVSKQLGVSNDMYPFIMAITGTADAQSIEKVPTGKALDADTLSRWIDELKAN